MVEDAPTPARPRAEDVTRPARRGDVDALYEVCLLTGSDGDDASDRYDDPSLLGHVYVGPYLAHDLDLARVVDDGRGAQGYVLATPDTRRFEQWCEREWWPGLRRRLPLDGSARASDAELIAQIHHPVPAPDEVVDPHPAHLHIDLLPRWQGRGVGRFLMRGRLDALADAGVRGAHLGVSRTNERAIGFYATLGFAPVFDDGDRFYLRLTL